MVSEFADRHQPRNEPICEYSETMFIRPFYLFLSVLAHYVNREQAAIIDYLKEENRALRARLGEKRIRFTDAERRRLAVKARKICRSVLREIGCIVTPETLLRWDRRMVAKQYGGSRGGRGAGRRKVSAEQPPLGTPNPRPPDARRSGVGRSSPAHPGSRRGTSPRRWQWSRCGTHGLPRADPSR